MKKLLLTTLLATLSIHAFADSSMTVNAKVLRVTPEIGTEYVDVEVCRNASRPVSGAGMSGTSTSGTDLGGAVLGAIVGGGIGSMAGKGNGKVAAAAVGAAIGAVVGDRTANANTNVNTTSASSSRYESYQKCDIERRPREVNNGYRVEYSYNGLTGETVMHDYPGKTIPATLTLSPNY